jgi:hypothetical protein
MVDDAREKTERIIKELQELGRHEEAEHLQVALSEKIEDALLLALREACQVVLTAIEAIDPNTEMLLEELRLEIDKRLTRHHPGDKPAG